MAQIHFTGNVANAELRQAGSKTVLGFSVAENHRKKNQQSGQFEDSGTTWHRVTFWGNALFSPEALHEAISQPKTMVTVNGKQETETWMKDGEERQSVKVTADTVGVMQKAGQSGGQRSGGYSNAYGQQADPWSNTAQDTGYPQDPPF